MVYLKNIAIALPKTVATPTEHAAHLGLSAAQAKVYEKIYGLAQFPIYEGDIIELMLPPAKQVLAQTDPAKIALIIYPHTIPFVGPFNRVLLTLQRRLGLEHALSFALTSNNCVGPLTALEIAQYFLKKQGDPEAEALILMGEQAYSPSCRLIRNSSITGDAAAAVVVSQQKGDEVLDTLVRVHGEYAEVFKTDEADPVKVKAFEQNYVPFLARVIEDILRKNKLSLEQIKLIIPHNVNLLSWANVSKLLGLPLEKIYLKNVSRTAHCFGADLFLNYVAAQEDARLAEGDYYLTVTVGLGAYFAAALLRKGGGAR